MIITDPFFRQLYKKIAEQIEDRISALARGSALTHGHAGLLDVNNTGSKYQAEVAYIQALQDVVGIGVVLDHEIYGTKKDSGDD